MSLYDHLPEPKEVPSNTVRVLPLGGLGEVGRNMTTFETQGKILVLDVGVLFPNETQPGVDVILPDFGYLEDRLDDIVAIALTHGHEDHIGGVPYLLRLREDLPIYGSEFTLALLEAKLDEQGMPTDNLHVVEEGERIQILPFELEFVHVSHSIPDAMAVYISTKAGNIFATGDFKMDPTPLDGRTTDIRSFARLAEEGIDLYLVDSTNAEVPGFVPTETGIGPVIENIFDESPGAVVVASFASNVHRVQQVIEAAEITGRKLALAGRSMERNMTIAEDLGYLEVPDDVVLELAAVGELPRDERAYMVTGSQGEPMAALARMARGEHNQIEVEPGDTIVLSSSMIPGNESAIYALINDLTALGAKVVYEANADIHVSGHAYSGEILYSYNVIQPRNVMPVHGEIRHLVANAKLAVKTGVDPQNVFLAENGVALDLHRGNVSIAGFVPNELIFVDGSSVGEVDEDDLDVRQTLANEGIVFLHTVIDTKKGEIVSGPTLEAVGTAIDEDEFADILPELEEALQNVVNPQVSVQKVEKALRKTLGRWLNRSLRRRPMIYPVVVDR